LGKYQGVALGRRLSSDPAEQRLRPDKDLQNADTWTLESLRICFVDGQMFGLKNNLAALISLCDLY
jgi:hypothetical protein